jgi:hypothetical protein
MDREAYVRRIGAHFDCKRGFGDEVSRRWSDDAAPDDTLMFLVEQDFLVPSSRPRNSDLPLAAHGKTPLPYLTPLALASISVRPTHATSGSVSLTQKLLPCFKWLQTSSIPVGAPSAIIPNGIFHLSKRALTTNKSATDSLYLSFGVKIGSADRVEVPSRPVTCSYWGTKNVSTRPGPISDISVRTR